MPVAPQSQPFVNSRDVSAERVRDRALKACNTCAMARVMNAMVTAWRSPSPSAPYQRIPTANAASVQPASKAPCQTMSQPKAGVISGSAGSRGGRLMTSGAEGSSARAIAGKMSVTRFSHRICMTPSGSGQPSMMAAPTVTISAKLQENK